MAGAANVTTDTSVLSRLDQQLLKAERVLALCSGLAVFGLMVLAVVSVSGRNFFNAPCAGLR
jgi:tRNA1(Val) A37 N6-methylase TrmN6